MMPRWASDPRVPNCNGAFLGFSGPGAAYDRVLVPWERCALDRDCIAPPGSDRSNHRQDQAVLSVLAHEFGYACGPYCKDGCNGVNLHLDGHGAVLGFCKQLGFTAIPEKGMGMGEMGMGMGVGVETGGDG